jgi:hypothetical protein
MGISFEQQRFLPSADESEWEKVWPVANDTVHLAGRLQGVTSSVAGVRWRRVGSSPGIPLRPGKLYPLSSQRTTA